jgi:hypothetical protein
MAGEAVPPDARIDHQHGAAGAEKLEGGRHSGKAAADDDRVVWHDLFSVTSITS